MRKKSAPKTPRGLPKWRQPKAHGAEMPTGQFSEHFVHLMRNQSRHAYYRYGPTSDNAQSVDFAAEARHRMQLYQRTGNTEYLVDAATFCMCEFVYPHVLGARYAPSAKSPGLVSGISSREMAELNKENGIECKL